MVSALEANGIVTLLPFGGGCPFDIAALLPTGEIVRIQVKCGRVRGACVEFNAHSTDHGRGRQDYRGRADVIATHVRSIDRIFVVPVADCPRNTGILRLAPTRNNQHRGIRYAEDYTFERWVDSVL